MKKIYLIFITLIFILTGCSSTERSSYSTENVESTAYDPSYNNQSYTTKAMDTTTDRMIQRNYDVYIKNEDVVKASSTLKELMNKYKGYLLYSYESYNTGYSPSANYTIRIPSESIDSFNEELNSVGTIESMSLNSNDLTDTYKDNEARLNALKAQEARLVELMAQAETIQDLITIEEKLIDVQSQIEYITSDMQNIEKVVQYTTYSINITAPYQYTPVKKDFLSTLIYSFQDSISGFIGFTQDIIVGLIYLLPYIIIIVLILLIFRKGLKNFFTSLFTNKNTSQNTKDKYNL